MLIKCHNCFNYVIEIDEYIISFTDIYICENCISTGESPSQVNNSFNLKTILKNIFIKIKSYLNIN